MKKLRDDTKYLSRIWKGGGTCDATSILTFGVTLAYSIICSMRYDVIYEKQLEKCLFTIHGAHYLPA